MSNEASISETLQAVLQSATVTAADANMHAEVRIHRNGLLIAVASAASSDERLIPWGEIDRAADLEVMVSSETLVAVEKIKRSATDAPYPR